MSVPRSVARTALRRVASNILQENSAVLTVPRLSSASSSGGNLCRKFRLLARDQVCVQHPKLHRDSHGIRSEGRCVTHALGGRSSGDAPQADPWICKERTRDHQNLDVYDACTAIEATSNTHGTPCQILLDGNLLEPHPRCVRYASGRRAYPVLIHPYTARLVLSWRSICFSPDAPCCARHSSRSLSWLLLDRVDLCGSTLHILGNPCGASSFHVFSQARACSPSSRLSKGTRPPFPRSSILRQVRGPAPFSSGITSRCFQRFPAHGSRRPETITPDPYNNPIQRHATRRKCRGPLRTSHP